jgi:hypothetical protein
MRTSSTRPDAQPGSVCEQRARAGSEIYPMGGGGLDEFTPRGRFDVLARAASMSPTVVSPVKRRRGPTRVFGDVERGTAVAEGR